MSDERPIAPAIRDQAIAWFTLAQSGCLSEIEREELERWRHADHEHERAWQRMAGIPARLRGLDDPLARRSVERAGLHAPGRRQSLKLLVGGALLGGLAWQSRDSHWLQGRLADLHTATGERLQRRLDDGTQVWLNTNSALDLRYDASQRLLCLRYGEVEILGAADHAGRPLLVQAGQVRLRALGTRFSVRQDGQRTRLGVSQGRVAIEPFGDIIEAGWQTLIDANGVHPPGTLEANATAWVEGFIIAERMRLDDFIAELGRHRPGLLRCHPAVAELRLSGAFPLDDGERILAMLQHSLPVRIERHTRFWISVVPA